ncbi:MAG: hypothetical protein HZC23_14455 [Rhodocyclales bacterium]|nr:hypothetical protein [Rhodocyclales bacterium]
MDKVDFSYEIADERLIAYSRLAPLDRLRWLDEVRRFTLLVRAAPPVPHAAASAEDVHPEKPAGER